MRHCIPIELSENDEARFWRLVDRSHGDDSCWEWQGARLPAPRLAYGMFKLHNRKMAKAHRVAFFIANRELPTHLFVLHNCDNPSCCNPRHLFLGTHQDNMDDKVKKGRCAVGQALHPERRARGVQNGNAKLNDERVREIRLAHAAGESVSSIARRYGVAWPAINRVVRLRGWRHVVEIVIKAA